MADRDATDLSSEPVCRTSSNVKHKVSASNSVKAASMQRPIRSTRGIPPKRLHDTDYAEVRIVALDNVRKTHASRLSRLIGEIKRGIDTHRLRATMLKYSDEIDETLTHIEDANVHYVGVANDKGLIDFAAVWLSDQQNVAQKCLDDIKLYLENEDVISQSELASVGSLNIKSIASHSNHPSRNSSFDQNRELKLKAAQAHLKTKQLKRRSEIQLQASKEMAEFEMKKVQYKFNELKQKSVEEVEVAELEEQMLEEFLLDDYPDYAQKAASQASETLIKRRYVEQWLSDSGPKNEIGNERVSYEPSEMAQQPQPLQPVIIEPPVAELEKPQPLPSTKDEVSKTEITHHTNYNEMAQQQQPSETVKIDIVKMQQPDISHNKMAQQLQPSQPVMVNKNMAQQPIQAFTSRIPDIKIDTHNHQPQLTQPAESMHTNSYDLVDQSIEQLSIADSKTQSATVPVNHNAAHRQSRLHDMYLVDTKGSLNPAAPPWEPKINDNSCNLPLKSSEPIDKWIDKLVLGQETSIAMPEALSTSDHLAQAIVRVESERDLPKIALPIFDGSALLWPKFVEQFYVKIHCRPCITDTRRMDLLQSHVKGDAQKLVRGLGYTGRNYGLALKELKAAFGHHLLVARAYIEGVTSGPAIPTHDPVAMREFYVKIRDCITTLDQLHYRADLSSSDTLLRASKRLPADKVGKWNEHIKNVSNDREPSLIDLQNWLRERVKADLSPYAVKVLSFNNRKAKQTQVFSSSVNRDKQSIVTLNTAKIHPDENNKQGVSENQQKITSSSSVASGKEQNSTTKKACPICTEQHYLFRCNEYLNKGTQDRWSIVKEKKLCFNCLKFGHQTVKCLSPVRCRQSDCNKKHHTTLHNISNEEVKINVTKGASNKDKVYFQIVPVQVQGQNGTVIKTYALLDNASEVTLIKEDLAEELGLKGSQKMLSVKTLIAESSALSRQVAVTLRSCSNLNTKSLHIPELWTVNTEFQCPAQHIGENENCDHLQGLEFPDIEHGEIKLLIGANVPQAHIQSEVRVG